MNRQSTTRTPPGQPSPGRRLPRLRLLRLARIALWMLACAAALALLLVLTLALPAGRQFLLRTGLDIADRHLPGTLSARETAWARIGELALDGILWTDGPDTLAGIETLRLRISPGDLRRRDLTVDLALAAGVTVDLPAIQARLHACVNAAPDTSDQGTAILPMPWLRTGSIPPLPSVAVRQLSLARVAVVTVPGHTAHLDSLDLALDLRRGHRPQLAACLRARPLPTLGVSWRLRGAAEGDTLAFLVAPLHLAAPARLPAERDLPLDGRLRLPLALVDSLLDGRVIWPSLRIDELLVEGDLGVWRMDARLDGFGPGRIALHSEMPAAPVALLTGLAALTGKSPYSAAALETLATRWGDHGVPGIALDVNLVPPQPSAPLTAARLQALGRLRLPAPAAIAPLLPPLLAVDDLGPLELDLEAAYDGTRTPAAASFELDLQRTPWLHRARLSLTGDLEAIDRARLELALPGLALTAAGRADRRSLELDLSATVPDAALLRRWRDPALADLDLQANLEARVHGPWALPHTDLNANLAATAPDLILPRAVVSATLTADTMHVAAGLPQGLRNRALDLDELEFIFAGTPVDSWRSLRARVALTARAAPAAMALRGHLEAKSLDTSPTVAFTGEHLTVTMDRRSLASTGPWHAAYTAHDTTACLTGLQLAGSLGHMDIGGCLTPDNLRADLDLELRLLLETIRQFLPQEQQDHLPSGTVVASGKLAARGRPHRPWASGDLQIAMLDQPDLAGLGVDLALSLAGSGPAPVDLDPGRPGWQDGNALLVARLLDRQIPQVTLTALLPWPPAGARTDTMDLRLDAPALDMARLAPLLPPGHAVAGGILALRAHVRGVLPADAAEGPPTGMLDAARDLGLALAAEVHLEDLDAQLADGTRILLNGTAAVSGTSREPVARADLFMTGDLGRLDLHARARPDSLAVRTDLDLRIDSDAVRSYLPVEQQPLLPQGVLSIAGVVTTGGVPEAPWTAGDLRLAVVDQPELQALSTTVTLLVGGRGSVPAEHVGHRPGWRPQSLRLNLRLLDADTELLRLTALAPLPHSAAASDSVDMRLDIPGLDLAHLLPLLPAGTSVTGRLEAATRAAGLMPPGHLDPDLNLAGYMSTENLRVQLPEGSRLAVSGRIDLAGTSLAPQIRGGLHVAGGLIRLPDPPPVLLPATGEALLWGQAPAAISERAPDGASDPATPPDRTVSGIPAAGPAAPLPRILPDLVLTMTSPGGLWLRGQGLDAELGGDISLLLRGDRIALEGELQAIQGTMRQLGHVFRLERGRVVFDGSETELNPELDLALGVRVAQHRIGILLGGTALAPNLQFTSVPELSEADILATLLFGKPLDELDEGQTGLLAARAAQIAAAYGSARLQENLARQLGVDVVSIAPREGDEETTALTVGKYLNPRVLVRYEQLLRKGSAFFVHLDYAFTGAFRLHTQVSQGEESGLQLKWQRDR